MKKVIKKGLSCLIAGLMAFSGISGALAANEGGASDAGNENVIDSEAFLAGHRLSVGDVIG